MPTQTWTWTPDYGLERETTATVSKIQFGDGYSQRIRTGINTVQSVWSVALTNRPFADVDAMEAFLEQHQGAVYFMWPDFNDPGNTAKHMKVICDKWKRSYSAPHHDTLTMTLTRVFDT